MPYRIQDPVINIYVGTSPATVGRYVNQELQGLPDTERRKVTNLFIDTMQLREELFNGMRTPGSDTLRLAMEPYQGSGTWSAEQKHNMFVRTGSEPAARLHKPGITVAGAGGVRNNGHFTFCFWSKRIRQRLIEKINLVTAPPQDLQDDQPADTLRINIIVFLGGGTGSGIVSSLALLTRYALKNKLTPMTAIYGVLPEQPRGQTADMQRRQRSNAFATLLEITSLFKLSKRPDARMWHLGELAFDAANLQIVDVIYLYGHGLLTSHEDIYQHLAMDLVARMQNGHGAGAERHRQLPDLIGLHQEDTRGVPTFAATSGVTEIILPRQALIAALARRACQRLLERQSHALPEQQHTLIEQRSTALSEQIVDQLRRELDDAQRRHTPEPVDTGILDEGEAFWELIEAHGVDYREQLRYQRAEIVEALEGECARLIHAEVTQHHDAIFDRRIRLYQELAQRVGKVSDEVPALSGAAFERDTDLEDRAFRPPWLPFRRVSPAQFADYVERLQVTEVEAANAENLREALGRLRRWLKAQEELARRDQDVVGRTAHQQTNADTTLTDGKLLQPHPYRRAALRDAALVDRLYQDLLRRNRLLNEDGELQLAQALVLFQAGQQTNSTRPVALSRDALERFFTRLFTTTMEQSYNTVLELILAIGGEELLRDHLRWALRYALGHLRYHPYQEPETNGRIARQLDVSMVVAQRRAQVEELLNQESSRPEAQDGLKLHNSLDPDRITVLYTEYGIALRAIKGMYEANDSYLEDYQRSQDEWRNNAALPVHASSLMQELVSEPFAHGQSLVQLFESEDAPTTAPRLNGVQAGQAAGGTL